MTDYFFLVAACYTGWLAYDRLKLRIRNDRLTEAVRDLLYLCEEEADFSNGITDGSYDEGEVRARHRVAIIKSEIGVLNTREWAELSDRRKRGAE